MAKEKNKNEGPSCACGKEDLYEEWLKNEKKNKEAAISNKKEGKDSSSVNSNKKENQK